MGAPDYNDCRTVWDAIVDSVGGALRCGDEGWVGWVYVFDYLVVVREYLQLAVSFTRFSFSNLNFVLISVIQGT